MNHIGQLLSAHVTRAVGDILSAILTKFFKGYFECACGVFAHMYVCDCRARCLSGDTRDDSRCPHGSEPPVVGTGHPGL